MQDLRRRDFLKGTAASLAGGSTAWARGHVVSLVIDPKDAIAMAAPVQRFVKEQERTWVTRYDSVGAAPANILCVVAAGRPGPEESMSLSMSKRSGRPVLLASGSDPRGLLYALFELEDRVAADADLTKPVSERPANKVRSVARLFISEVEDKPWYNDRAMWPAYLTMLATHRFNRFQLAFGIGYDFLRNVTDAYFLFAYPFFLSVPGYNVRAVNLPDAERDRNLAMLKFISEQTVARGLDFQLGLWMHGYQWIDSPHPNYTIVGLTSANHGRIPATPSALLQACPAITGVTFRCTARAASRRGAILLEDGVRRRGDCGRKVEIDMHSKGIDRGMIDVGLATGMPLNVSPKFWAEHMGMPYHQADIRKQEIPKPDRNGPG